MPGTEKAPSFLSHSGKRSRIQVREQDGCGCVGMNDLECAAVTYREAEITGRRHCVSWFPQAAKPLWPLSLCLSAETSIRVKPSTVIV